MSETKLSSLKVALHQACIELLNQKTASLERAIADAQQAASEDTKSSAGDKFETSREMIKREIDKNNAQLRNALEMLQHLQQLNPGSLKEKVSYGSLVETPEGIYYFSVSLGKVMLEGKSYFALSMASPIGQALKDRSAGQEFSFRGRNIRIEGIA
jgi:transcription elongation GreA/GreB family factor